MTKHHVLLVDDEPGILIAMEEALRDEGFVVTTAPSGRDAKMLIDTGLEPDVLCSDICMPGKISGVQLAQEATKVLPNIRVLLTTGYDEQVIGDKRAGFRVLGKPCLPSTLVRRIRDMIEN